MWLEFAGQVMQVLANIATVGTAGAVLWPFVSDWLREATGLFVAAFLLIPVMIMAARSGLLSRPSQKIHRLGQNDNPSANPLIILSIFPTPLPEPSATVTLPATRP